ncbi:hypothetical protein B0H21DRAFT_733324 [Amylocystis lapponica]|nr:hypothetical protein B0H21DRAFT_733324 [Amylocystis lapponica]
MTHAERCEAVRHCRWVDEVVPDAPWVIDESFIQKSCIRDEHHSCRFFVSMVFPLSRFMNYVLIHQPFSQYKIDYVAHDEDPYAGAGTDDVYGYVKRQGKFLPTRRTPGVSTSDLLERIVQRYRARGFDAKLARMGHAELMAAGSDYDGSAPASTRGSRAPSVMR